MSLEGLVPLLASLGTLAGSWYWLRNHRHPEFVEQSELTLVRELLSVQHEAILRELERVHARLDRLPTPRP